MSGPGTVLIALALFALWTLATYVLEGRVRTLQRPEARRQRIVYAVVANLLIGTVVAGLAIRYFLRAESALDPSVFGIAPAARIPLSVTAAMLLGGVFLVRQRPSVWSSAVLLNGFSQTLVVSTAEVLVCWAVLGASVRAWGAGLPAPLPWLLGLIVAASAFGPYHFAHSPPFNTRRMVLLLSGVGVLTGVFFLVSGDIYGTIVFHNFMALKGVLGALEGSGRLEPFARVRGSLVAMAAAAVIILVTVDVALIRTATSGWV
ncbi:MAG: hypothetical protein PVG79_06330 [Gemmatimonadales bacterium]|jgi:hypothetical protein